MGGAIFNDEHYRTHFNIDLPCALTIMATVTSRPTSTCVILDAGRKAMSMDAAPSRALGIPDIKALKLSAEHTQLELQSPNDLPRIGDRVEFVVGYFDTTIYLHEEIIALRKGQMCGKWQHAER